MATSTFVDQLYSKFLGRAADTGGKAYWVQQIDSGAMSAAKVTQSFMDSPEFSGVVSPVALLYYTSLGRIPDAGGLQFWTQKAQSGAGLKEISAGFANSAEFKTKYDALSNDAFLDQLYLNVFSRAADAGGKSYWLSKMNSEGYSRSDVVVGFAASQEQAVAKGEQIKVIVQYHGILNTTPSQTQINAAIAQKDPLAVINSLYGNTAYKGEPVPGLVATGKTIAGKVVDGYIKGATVFADANGDGVWNEGEAKATTDDKGNFTLDGAKGKVVASGGTDLSTGKAFKGVLTAPEGATVVNPLTTLQQAFVDKGLTAEQAEAKVAKALGFDPDKVDLANFDPLGASLDANGGADAKALGAQLHAEAAKVANLLVTSASTLIGAAGGEGKLDLSSALNAVIQSVVSGIEKDSDGVVSLADSSFLKGVLTDAVQQSGDADLLAAASKVDGMADSFAKMTAEIAAKVDKLEEGGGDIAKLIAQIAQVQSVAQGDMASSLQDAADGGSLAGLESNFTGSALDKSVSSADIGDLDPNSTHDDAAVGDVNAGGGDTTTPPGGGGSGGGGGGGSSGGATFTVTNTGGTITFGGDATGNITVSESGGTITFSRGGIAATTTVSTSDLDETHGKITLDDDQTFVITADNATGLTIDGDGAVAVTALESTLNADLSDITATTITATLVGGRNPIPEFTGNLGNAKLILVAGSGVAPSVTLGSSAVIGGNASFVVSEGTYLYADAADLSGRAVTGNGVVNLELHTGDAASLDMNGIGSGTHLNLSIYQSETVDISSNTMLGSVDGYHMRGGSSLTLTAEQVSGKSLTGTLSGTSAVTIVDLKADTDLSGVNGSINSALNDVVVAGTVTTSANLTNVDLSKLSSLTIGADNGDAVTATVSPAQYVAWKNVATIGNNDILVSSDVTAPTSTVASAAYDEGADTLTITGTDFDSLLESGETAATDIKGRLDWTKLVWDINGDATTTANVGFSANDVSSAKVTNATTLTIALTSTKGVALEGTTGYGSTGNADTLDIAVGFARDISDNTATTDALSGGAITLSADATAPTASVTTATIGQGGNAVVQSTETGTAYLVKDTVTVTDVNSITSAGDNNFNSVAISTANINTNLAATGLVEGSYKVYTVDTAGNLSTASSNTVTIDTTPATISAVSILNTAMNIGDTVTATITVADAVGETLTLKAGSTIGGFTLGSLAKTDDTTYTATFTVTAAGADVAAGSDIPVSFTLVDPAGNESTAFTTAISQNADAIDANAPNAPAALDLAAADDTGESDSDNLTAGTSALTISGTAEANSTVTIYATDGTTVLGTATATDGNFSIDVSLAAGSHSLTAKTTDTAGNQSAASSALAVMVDTAAPEVTASALAYTEVTNTITVTGNGFASLLAIGEDANTDIKGRLDWSKISWDIGNDDADNVSFVVGDISSAKVTNGTTLTITLSSDKATALEGAADYGGVDDYLDVASGFFGDKAGNVMVHDALTAPMTITVAPDTTPPNTTITSAGFSEKGGFLSLYGSNFNSILESGESSTTDIKGRLDWTKLFWDLNGSGTARITFAESDIQKANVVSGTLSILLTSDKAAAIVASEDYAYRNNEDKLDVTAGYIRDLAGNAATSDGVENGMLSTNYTQLFLSSSSTSVVPVAKASYLEIVNFGNTATSYMIDASNVTSQYVMFDNGISTGQTYTVSNLGSTVKNVYVIPSVKATAGNIVVTGSSATVFTTGAGDDVLVSSATTQVSFDTGSGIDNLTGGDADDFFKFANADFTAEDLISGNGGEDVLYITGATTLTDAQFAQVTSIGSLALNGGVAHSITLGSNADRAFDNVRVTSPIDIGIINGETATSLTLNAASATDAISISNKPNSGNAGAMTVTGGSGNDMFIFGNGTAEVKFAATAIANGQDKIYIAAAAANVTLDFSGFLATTVANTTAVDFVTAGLDLSATNNLGIVFNKATLSGSDIATSTAANKIAVANDGKAVVLCANATDDSSAASAWGIYYIEDTDSSASQTWTVTLVGQVYVDNPGATAAQIGTMVFA